MTIAENKLHADALPSVMEITDMEALNYVTNLLEILLMSEQPLITQRDSDSADRRPSYEQAIEGNRQILKPLIPNRHYKMTALSAPVIDGDDEDDYCKAFESYRRFWLKEVPPITIRDYLLRFHRYCKSSAATYLTTGYLIHLVAIEQRALPITHRNVYRVFCAAFIISAKFIEDELYPMSRYATTAGLKKPDLARLEISFLLLINFEIKADRENLKQELKKWALLQTDAPDELPLAPKAGIV